MIKIPEFYNWTFVYKSHWGLGEGRTVGVKKELTGKAMSCRESGSKDIEKQDIKDISQTWKNRISEKY